ncbi:helix-turn-helix transcriptional regulator [Geminicoccus roseus]|uniref:helix-turn-helix transcriptional regulator n=1 Tax=Geminicoccus roseus TaxID=404900 RepID=UPI000421A15B|nr:AraC family transcriptional regulator [Geminicoccus roseus]
MQTVTTIERLARTAADFVPAATPERRLAPPADGVEHAVAVALGFWEEASLGDPMHKLVLVRSGALDLEGASGGWLILPGHLVFIPAERCFSLRTKPGTRLEVVHLDPARTPWHHHGCWVTAATPLASQLIERALGWNRTEAQRSSLAQSLFRTLALLCSELFCNPRMLWLPVATSPEMRQVVRYLSCNLADASAPGAAQAAGLSVRTLHRRCLAEFEMSWRAFVREARMMRALELMALGSPIGTVAGMVGFETVSAFTVAFSQRFGMPPSAYPAANAACGG